MKKFVVTLMSLIILSTLLLSACGSGRQEDEIIDGITYVAKTGELFKDTKEDKTRLKISFHKAGYGDNWAKVMGRAFLNSPGNENVYIVLDGDPELTSGLSSRLESGRNLSDIYFPLASRWEAYASRGFLEPMDDLYEMTVPGEDITVFDKITGPWKGYGKGIYDNTESFYCLPWNENITGIVYNETMFKKYNWEVPKTIDELVALGGRIKADTNGSVAPFVYPGTVGGYFDFFGTALWMQATGIDGMNEFMAFDSVEVFNPAKQPSLGKVKMLEAFEQIFGIDNVQDFALKGSNSKNHLAAQISFANGEAAMIINGNWMENESADVISANGIDIKMMRVPYLDDAKKDGDGEYIKVNYTAMPDYIIIPAQAAEKTLAKQFLAFMCKDDMLIEYTKATGAPRPFDYDVQDISVSPFIDSCLEIWSTSTNWFDDSKSPLYTNNKAKKFITINPYNAINAGNSNPKKFAAAEYVEAQTKWADWLSDVGL